jgi:Zinc metalloprotease (elastase)
MHKHHTNSSVRGILPPHILIALAQNGNDAQKRMALQNLSHDQSIRTSRMAHAMLTYRSVPGHRTISSDGKLCRTVSDAHNSEHIPGDIVRQEGQHPSHDHCVNEAYDGLGWAHAFYMQVFMRNSIDNEGLPLGITVHYGTDYTNAFWNGEHMLCGDGDHALFNRFSCCLEILGHELTHGIVECEARLAYLGQSGALNEHLADVFGCLIKQYAYRQSTEQADWLIGHGLFTDSVHGEALRSLKNPGSAYDDRLLGRDPQPATMERYHHTMEDNGGIHINSGIPNHAFYLAATYIGGYAWERTGRVWYETLTDQRLSATANFHMFAQYTLKHAQRLYDQESREYHAIRQAWEEVGILQRERIYAVSGMHS